MGQVALVTTPQHCLCGLKAAKEDTQRNTQVQLLKKILLTATEGGLSLGHRQELVTLWSDSLSLNILILSMGAREFHEG